MRYLTLGFLLASCFAVSGLAEESSPIGIGVKGGVPLNDAFVVREQNPVSYIADTHRYILGPYVSRPDSGSSWTPFTRPTSTARWFPLPCGIKTRTTGNFR
jgi:hypothetical protein